MKNVLENELSDWSIGYELTGAQVDERNKTYF